jgi:hypothetical protein
MVTFGYATSMHERRTAEDIVREAEKWTFRKNCWWIKATGAARPAAAHHAA